MDIHWFKYIFNMVFLSFLHEHVMKIPNFPLFLVMAFHLFWNFLSSRKLLHGVQHPEGAVKVAAVTVALLLFIIC